MKKKFFSIILTLCLIILPVAILVACGDEDNNDENNYNPSLYFVTDYSSANYGTKLSISKLVHAQYSDDKKVSVDELSGFKYRVVRQDYNYENVETPQLIETEVSLDGLLDVGNYVIYVSSDEIEEIFFSLSVNAVEYPNKDAVQVIMQDFKFGDFMPQPTLSVNFGEDAEITYYYNNAKIIKYYEDDGYDISDAWYTYNIDEPKNYVDGGGAIFDTTNKMYASVRLKNYKEFKTSSVNFNVTPAEMIVPTDNDGNYSDYQYVEYIEGQKLGDIYKNSYSGTYSVKYQTSEGYSECSITPSFTWLDQNYVLTAGEHNVQVKISCSDDNKLIKSTNRTMKIIVNKRDINIPTISPNNNTTVYYDGTVKTFTLQLNTDTVADLGDYSDKFNAYIREGDSGDWEQITFTNGSAEITRFGSTEDSCTYNIKYVITDNNYKWYSVEGDEVYDSFTIVLLGHVVKPENTTIEYTGDAISADEAFGNAAFTITGDTNGTNIGTYNVTINLNDGYVWFDDNSKDAYETTWEIVKRNVSNIENIIPALSVEITDDNEEFALETELQQDYSSTYNELDGIGYVISVVDGVGYWQMTVDVDNLHELQFITESSITVNAHFVLFSGMNDYYNNNYSEDQTLTVTVTDSRTGS